DHLRIADGGRQHSQSSPLPAPPVRTWQRQDRWQHAPQGAGWHADGRRDALCDAQPWLDGSEELRGQQRRVCAERLMLRGSGMGYGVCRAIAVLAISASVAGAQSLVADAAQRGDLNAVKALLSKKADANVAQGDGMTALHWAAERADLAMTTALLGANAEVKGT